MSTSPNQLPPRTRANIEITIFGFLVSLTLKGGLDTAYGHSLPDVVTWTDLWMTLWIPASVQLFIFLITIVRFVYGAYRLSEETQAPPKGLEPWLRLWHILGSLLLFILFYVAGLCVRNPYPFFLSLAAVHLWDFIWFLVSVAFSDRLTNKLKKVMRVFIYIDLATVIALIVVLEIFSSHVTTSGAIAMFVLAALDLIVNRKFFFHPDEWSEQ